MAERASSRSVAPAVRYVSLPTLVRTVFVLLRRDFWAHSRSRERTTILEEDIAVNNVGHFGERYLTRRTTTGSPTHKEGPPIGRL